MVMVTSFNATGGSASRAITPAGSPEKKALTAELAEMRAERKLLATDVSAAEKLAGHFKGGHFLGSSLGDIADGLGVLQDGADSLCVLLGLHGHIHESKGATRIGSTLSLNPGSSYEEGILQAAVVTIDAKKRKVKNYQLVNG